MSAAYVKKQYYNKTCVKKKRNWHEGRSRTTIDAIYDVEQTKALFSAVVLSSCGPCHESTTAIYLPHMNSYVLLLCIIFYIFYNDN